MDHLQVLLTRLAFFAGAACVGLKPLKCIVEQVCSGHESLSTLQPVEPGLVNVRHYSEHRPIATLALSLDDVVGRLVGVHARAWCDKLEPLPRCRDLSLCEPEHFIRAHRNPLALVTPTSQRKQACHTTHRLAP